jgi:hypothetical protein
VAAVQLSLVLAVQQVLAVQLLPVLAVQQVLAVQWEQLAVAVQQQLQMQALV